MNIRNLAYREIISKALADENIENFERLKMKICAKYGFSKIPSNADILSLAKNFERERLLPILRLKPVRSISGVNIIAVMSRPFVCPHGNCVYCPSIKGIPNSYTGKEPSTMRGIQNDFDPYRQVVNRLNQLKQIGHSLGKVELIVQGGTFSATPIDYQRDFIKDCLDALTGERSKNLDEAKIRAQWSQIKNVGITFETRPDYARKHHLNEMLNMGVTKIELGVQTIYDDVYQLVERGHTVEDVINATRIIKDSGLKVCYHMMLGLPGTDYQRDLNAFHAIFNDPDYKPDMLKIYPCLVIKGSKIYHWWKENHYHAYTTEQATDLIVEVKKSLPTWTRIMRIQRDIPAYLIIDGVKKSNLRQIVREKLNELGLKCRCIRCREVGHKLLTDNLDLNHIELSVRRYEASEGIELFIAFEDIKEDVLIGYIRLRIPSSKAYRPEITSEKTALIRELHIYGPLVPVGKRAEGAWQHKGYGKALLREAERISKEEYEQKKIIVMSALGSRNYFSQFGYDLEGPYMTKTLS